MTDILWFDVETTGTDAQADDLLQVAGYLKRDGEVVCGPFEFVVKQDKEKSMAKANDVVLAMHSETGLWDRLADGEDLAVVDDAISAMLDGLGVERARMAGNSVRLDMNFTEQYLTKTYAHLSYRVLDVSTLAFVALENGWIESKFEKKYTHDAVQDIQESEAEYDWLCEQIGGDR